MTLFSGFSGRSAISISTAEKEIVFVNENYMEILGWRKDDIIGRSWEELMPPGAAAEVQQPFHTFLKDKRPYTVDTQALTCDGKALFFNARCSILKAGAGSPDLVFTEMQQIDLEHLDADTEKFACAELVRDVTFELAAQTGRSKLRQLTNALIEVSGRAEQVLELLARVPGLLSQLDV
jgi:PAS domain S-box-containing protein